MELTELIQRPQLMDRDTLYELRALLALHPYHQTARLLMLQNLYLLHDATFDEELRRAALYITDRKTIFQMIEAAHYQLRKQQVENQQDSSQKAENRTVALIDTFLDSIPADENESNTKRKPTPADAAVDYVAYLLESESQQQTAETPQMKGQELIDTFLEQEQGRILLSNLPQTPEAQEQAVSNEEKQADSDIQETAGDEEEYFTETLARIYIRQGRYRKALDIIGRLNQQFPQKNAYFADQMRFLEKLIINNNKNKN